MSFFSLSHTGARTRKLYVHRNGDSNGGTLRVALKPRSAPLTDLEVEEDARLLDEFLADLLPARTYDALAQRIAASRTETG